MLDALEKHAADKIEGINLGEIEWYHRLRNELYHQGNGLTVERDKVEIYAQLAKILFKNLYDIDLLPAKKKDGQVFGKFMERWVELERRLHALAAARGAKPYPRALIDGIQRMHKEGHLTATEVQKFDDLRMLRNLLVHGQVDLQSLNPGTIDELNTFIDKLPPVPDSL